MPAATGLGAVARVRQSRGEHLVATPTAALDPPRRGFGAAHDHAHSVSARGVVMAASACPGRLMVSVPALGRAPRPGRAARHVAATEAAEKELALDCRA